MHSMKQQVDQPINANCPNLIILDEAKRTTLLIDVTCPMDVNMIKAVAEKHKKYRDLETAMKKQYKLCKI
eukprot:1550755-Ditylum_brightwellii.AAC.1